MYEERVDEVWLIRMKRIGFMDGSITTELVKSSYRLFRLSSCVQGCSFDNQSHTKYYRIMESISLLQMKVPPLKIMHRLLDMLFHLGAHTYWSSKHFQVSTSQVQLKTMRNKHFPLSRRDFACYCEPGLPAMADHLFFSVIKFLWCHSNNFCQSLGNSIAMLPLPSTHVPSRGPMATTNFKNPHEHHFQFRIYASTSYHVKTYFCTKKHVFRRWSSFLTSLSLTPLPILSISQIHVQSCHFILLALVYLALTSSIYYCAFLWSHPYFQK